MEKIDKRRKYTDEKIIAVIRLINEGKENLDICNLLDVKRNLILDLRRGKHRPEKFLNLIDKDKQLKLFFKDVDQEFEKTFEGLKVGNIYSAIKTKHKYLIIGICKIKVDKRWEEGVVYKRVIVDSKFNKMEHMNFNGSTYCIEKFDFVENICESQP